MKKHENKVLIITLGQSTQIRIDTATGCYRTMRRNGWAWSQVAPDTLGANVVALADNLAQSTRGSL